MKRFYYMREKAILKNGKYKNDPVVTVCLMKVLGGKVARGWSICSTEEAPNLKKGRDRAAGMAMKALVNGKSDEPIRRERAVVRIFDVIEDVTEMPYYRSEFMPQLNDFEERLLT